VPGAAEPAARAGFTLSVVMPCFNERATIEEILRRVRAAPFEKEIVVVDDGSSDGTREILKRLEQPLGLRLIFHEENRGKGAALRSGFAAATGDAVVIQDADLEYDPQDYPELLAPIRDGRADVVFGSRFQEGRNGSSRWHYACNRLLTFLSNLFTDLDLTDMETCYKAFRADVARRLTIRSRRFGVEPELTAGVARLRCRVFEVPVRYHGRDVAHGKKIRARDALDAVWSIVRFNLFG
jgi:glycosyltransferase involved in cell wall biosynthesis